MKITASALSLNVELFQTWASATPQLNYQLAIIQRQEPYALVGCCGLRGMGLTAGEMELGLELAPTYWGRYAYATEVGQALLDFGFRELRADWHPESVGNNKSSPESL